MKRYQMKIFRLFAESSNADRFLGNWRQIMAVVACVLFCQLASANCMDGRRMVGVNLSGAEFAADKLPGTYAQDYIYPDVTEMSHFQTDGMNTFRLPFLWERIQPQLFSPLDPAELQRIVDAVAAARSLGMCIILDVHNFGQYRGQPLNSAAVPAWALTDLWVRLLNAFNDPANVAFDLMNEPAYMSIGDWANAAQNTLNVLRLYGARHLVLVAGGSWSGAHSWYAKSNGISNADAFQSFQDPANNYMIEVHQYADADFSGTGDSCVDPASLSAIMANITQWANTTQKRLFLGEFGVPDNAPCLSALSAIVNGAGSSPVWGGWTYWAAGAWLATYPFTIQPDANGDKPQMAILKNGM